MRTEPSFNSHEDYGTELAKKCSRMGTQKYLLIKRPSDILVESKPGVLGPFGCPGMHPRTVPSFQLIKPYIN
jgi:hypothetical protein